MLNDAHNVCRTRIAPIGAIDVGVLNTVTITTVTITPVRSVVFA